MDSAGKHLIADYLFGQRRHPGNNRYPDEEHIATRPLPCAKATIKTKTANNDKTIGNISTLSAHLAGRSGGVDGGLYIL